MDKDFQVLLDKNRVLTNVHTFTILNLMQIDGFDWDNGNLFKNEKSRGISHESIEKFFHGEIWVAPDLKHSEVEERFFAIGKTHEGKCMIVAFTFRIKAGTKLIRPISARYMHKKEVLKYEQAFTQNEDR